MKALRSRLLAMREPELRELRPGAYAYLQHGSWGFSNAGLVTDGDASLLVDTLYDLRLTQRMLDAMRSAVPAAHRIGTLVNTHANGDHCWGNQLVAGAEIVSSRAAAREMLELSPGRMSALLGVARRISALGPRARRLLRLLGRLGVPRVAALEEAAEFAIDCFGSFEFAGITLTLPTTTFDGGLTLHVGQKRVDLIEVGPAHTKGDIMVWSPDDRVVWTGDILFIDSHPILWEGPVRNWVAACDRLLALDVDVIVPGHGPVTDKAGVQRVKDYWVFLQRHVERGRAAGASTEDLARQALAEGVADWGEAHRVIANVDAIRRELDGDTAGPDPVRVMAMMSRLAR